VKLRAVLFVAIIASATLAFGRDEFDLKVANIDVLRDRAVQDEIGITEGQRTTLNKYADAFSKGNQAKIDEYKKAKKQPDAALQKFTMNAFITLRTNVLKSVSDGQLKRLREITLQIAGPRAILDPVVAKRVGLTDAEYQAFKKAIIDGDTKIAKIKGEIGKKIQLQFKNVKKPKTKEEADAINKKVNAAVEVESKKRASEFRKISAESDSKVGKIVNKTYLERLRALMGKPFEPKTPAKK
jgi:hypothetical protein